MPQFNSPEGPRISGVPHPSEFFAPEKYAAEISTKLGASDAQILSIRVGAQDDEEYIQGLFKLAAQTTTAQMTKGKDLQCLPDGETRGGLNNKGMQTYEQKMSDATDPDKIAQTVVGLLMATPQGHGLLYAAHKLKRSN